MSGTSGARTLAWIVLLLVLGCGSSVSYVNGHAQYDERDAYHGDLPPTQSPPVLEQASWTTTAPSTSDAAPVLTDPDELPKLRLASSKDVTLPLKHTAVNAHLLGFIAEVQVTQTFHNPHDKPIEVVYIFPLPENSAVGAMHMKIGSRIIRAKIEERQKARVIYREAKKQGHTAALLEQERPNIFTQSVANIAPGEQIDVVIRYVQDLTYDNGQYEFVFPMVVGPRFIPGTPIESAMKGDGTYQNTDSVPDASRITPPYLGKGTRSGHDISVQVHAENALPIRDFKVPTHEVASKKHKDGALELKLAGADAIPNRDFVLRYRVTGKEPRATLLTSADDKNGYFALVVHPPALNVDELVGKRELVFVVDSSGSMSGKPLGMCKSAIRAALDKMRPWDTFNVLTFSGSTRRLFEKARPANRTNIAEALTFLANTRAGGGTMMGNAVTEALRPDVAGGRHRYVFFLTDGYVGGDAEIVGGSKRLVAALEKKGQKARVFGFGVGSSVNRHLLEGLSRSGKGIAVYATNREDPLRAVNQFYRYIDRAVLTNVRLSWGGLDEGDLFPRPIPDLFASHPIIVHGRFGELDEQAIEIIANVGEKELRLPVNVKRAIATGKRGGVLGALWARSKVQYLEEEGWIGVRTDAPELITELGLAYELVTAYTSFIAVDESRKVGDGVPTKIVQPVEVPEGVDGVAAGARFQYKSRTVQTESYAGGANVPPPQPAPEASDADYGGRCLCRAAGEPQRGSGPAWLLFAIAAAAIVRRRR